MDKVIGGAIVLWACITLWFMGCEIIKGLRSKKNMAVYPTPKSEWVKRIAFEEEAKHLKQWMQAMYPQAYAEWKAIYDIQRKVVDDDS